MASLVAQLINNPPTNAGNSRDMGLIPVSGRSSGEGNGRQLQYSCVEDSHGQSSLVGYNPGGRHTCKTLKCGQVFVV